MPGLDGTGPNGAGAGAGRGRGGCKDRAFAGMGCRGGFRRSCCDTSNDNAQNLVEYAKFLENRLSEVKQRIDNN